MYDASSSSVYEVTMVCKWNQIMSNWKSKDWSKNSITEVSNPGWLFCLTIRLDDLNGIQKWTKRNEESGKKRYTKKRPLWDQTEKPHGSSHGPRCCQHMENHPTKLTAPDSERNHLWYPYAYMTIQNCKLEFIVGPSASNPLEKNAIYNL